MPLCRQTLRKSLISGMARMRAAEMSTCSGSEGTADYASRIPQLALSAAQAGLGTDNSSRTVAVTMMEVRSFSYRFSGVRHVSLRMLFVDLAKQDGLCGMLMVSLCLSSILVVRMA